MPEPLPMTPGRWIALAVGTPVALLVIGFTALDAVAWAGQGSYPVHLSIPVSAPTARVSVDYGQVTLEQGAPGRVLVTGTAHYALVRSTVTWRSAASGLAIDSRCHQITGPCSFDYTVAVPVGLTVRAANGSGDLTARGLTGRLVLTDDSGNVTVSAASGNVLVMDSSGNISGSRLTGTRLTIEDQSGDITLTGLTSQDVTVTNQSGNITLTFTAVPGTVRINDQSGDITLKLPAGSTSYRVTASTASGQTHVGVPHDLSSPHVITVTDSSGNISITR